MPPARLQAGIITCALAAGVALAWAAPRFAANRVVDVGVWFEPVTFYAPAIGSLTQDDIEIIAGVARSELTTAFTGLRISFSDRRDATYRVRVVQQLRDLRFRRTVGIAGEARSVAGFGGSAAVNFEVLANHAVAYAAPGTERAAIVAAIGRGGGRAAVHELTHLLLPTAPVQNTEDAASYEYASSARLEQYYGDMHWARARPLLEKRLGLRSQPGD